MKVVHRYALIALVCLAWCGVAQAAGVLDKVPADAMIVIKISNLDQFSQKIAKWATDIGIADLAPVMSDPLGDFERQMNISKGLDRAGEMAIVFPVIGNEPNVEESMIVLMPTKDYKAFIGNFEGIKIAEGAVSVFTEKNDNKEMYVADWGGYAALSPTKERLAKKPGAAGLKLSALAAQDGVKKDALVFFNIPLMRDKALKGLEEARTEMVNAISGAANDKSPEAALVKRFVPVIKVAMNQYLNLAKRFVDECDGAMIGLHYTDAGINVTFAADFKAGSYLGGLASKTKNSKGDLMAGLPSRKYFAFGGGIFTPEVTRTIVADAAGPITKELLAAGEDGKTIASTIDAITKSTSTLESMAMGYTVPVGALGADSILQAVSVLKGDAKLVASSQKQVMDSISKMLAGMPATAGVPPMTMDYKSNAKTIDGVAFDTITTNVKFDQNDPQAVQMQDMYAFIYGPNGLSGNYGVLDPKTMVVVQGGSEALIQQTVAAAKAGTDTVGKVPSVLAVSKELPAERFAVEYVDLAQILTTGVRVAQLKGGLPIKFQVPADLSPLGFSASTSGNAIRMDMHIPTSTVKSLVAAGMQSFAQLQGGGGGGNAGPGQPGGL